MIPRVIRRAIMISLISSFFIIAPLLIAYTAGFRFDPKTYHILQTGVLSIDIRPRSAQVFVNDIAINKGIPLRLANRAPGLYHIRIQQENYISWEQDIHIESNKTAYIKNITLLKNPQLQEIKNIIDVEHIYSYPTSPTIFLLHKENNLYTISSYNTKTEKIIPILRSDTIPTVDISATQPYVMIIDKQTIQIVSFDNPGNPTAFDIDNAPTQWQWIDDKFQPLYIQQKNTIYQLSFVSADMIAKKTLKKNIPWYIYNNTLWTIDGTILSNENTNIDNIETYILDNPITKIVDIQNNYILVQDTQHSHLIARNIETNSIATIEGTNNYYNPFNETWYIYSAWEISTIDRQGSIQFLTRSSDEIFSLTTIDEYNNLAIHNSKGLHLFNTTFYIWQYIDLQHTIKKYSIFSPDRILTISDDKNNLYYTQY